MSRPYNYETPRCRMWFTEMVTLGGPRLNPQLTQQLFEIGFVDRDFARRLPLGAGLDRPLVKGLK